MIPLGERILVKPIVEETDKTASGILIPKGIITGKDNEELIEAEVIEIPFFKEVKSIKKPYITIKKLLDTKDQLRVDKGDKVLVPKSYGTVYSINKVPHIIIRQSDIIAIL